jgi:hypothetical protein
VDFDPGTAVPRREDFGRGAYRRRIDLLAVEGAVEANLEDDFHRMRLWLHHDGDVVRRVEAESLRIPWTTCAAAADVLQRLEGLPLTRSHRAVAAYADPRTQCTHLFDLACVAVGAAHDATPRRRFDIAVADRPDGAGRARLERDGETRVEWSIEGMEIRGPAPFAGRGLVGGGFAAWSESELDADLAEAAQLLRRAVLVGMGRAFQMDALARASDIPGGTCHTYRDGVMQRGLRIRGSTFDFSERPDSLLQDLHD